MASDGPIPGGDPPASLLTSPNLYQPPDMSARREEISLSELLRILRRRFRTLFVIVVLITGGAALTTVFRTPTYTAEAVLLLGARQNDLQTDRSPAGNPMDFAALRSELDVLTSSSLLQALVDRAQLTSDPEFNPKISSLAPPPSSQGTLERWKKQLFEQASPPGSISRNGSVAGDPQQVPASPSPAGVPATAPRNERLSRAEVAENVVRHIRVLNDGRSYTVRIQLDSTSSAKAAALTNLLVDLYLNNRQDSRSRGIQQTSTWLSDRVDELKAKVRDSEQKIQKFREHNELIETRGATMSAQQLSELSTQLILARTDRAQSEAKYKRIQELQSSPHGLDSASEVLSSSLIQRLREQEADLARQEAEISTTYGDKHPKIINLRSQIADLERKIQDEVSKVARSVAGDVDVSRTREATLARNLAEIQQKLAEGARAEVQLHDLERELDSNRILLQNFSAQSKDTEARKTLNSPDAEVLSSAEPPRRPSSIRAEFVILGAFFGSILVATAFVVAFDQLESGFFSANEVQTITGLRVYGMIPTIPGAWRQRGGLINYARDKPHSRYSESLRSVWTMITMRRSGSERKVIVVTSSGSAEGKTLFATSLARQVASTGARVLLIEADLAKPMLVEALKLKPRLFLNSLLSHHPTIARSLGEGLPQALTLDRTTGLHLLAADPQGQLIHGLLASERMGELLRITRQAYDLVVIDTPPVMAVSEVATVAKLADLCLYVIRWRKTPRELALNGLAHMNLDNGKKLGIVLTRVDLARYAAMGYNDRTASYSRLREYFVD